MEIDNELHLMDSGSMHHNTSDSAGAGEGNTRPERRTSHLESFLSDKMKYMTSQRSDGLPTDPQMEENCYIRLLYAQF